MCGITTLINYKKNFIDKDQFFKSTKKILHRGPEDCRILSLENCYLGHTHLKIRDDSQHNQQPFKDYSGRYFITYNGEIYNTSEIQKILKENNIPVKTKTDTELIVNLFSFDKNYCLNNLNGMYVFSIWDNLEKKLVIARDKVGIKTLFYTNNENVFYCSSEIKSFKELNFKFKFNLPSLDHLLIKGYTKFSESTFENIKQIAPGEVITLKDKKISHNYIKFDKKKFFFKSFDEANENFNFIFPKIIEDQIQSDRPIGLLKSGGVDSNLIHAFLKNQNLKNFTATFNEKTYDESHLAKLDIKDEKKHEIINLTDTDIKEDLINVLNYSDNQLIDPAVLPLYKICKKIKKNQQIKVLISGDGADELFYGYNTYSASKISKYIKLIPDYLKRRIYKYFLEKNNSFKRYSYSEIIQRFFYSTYIDKNFPHAHFRDHFMEYYKDKLYGKKLEDYKNLFHSDYNKYVNFSPNSDINFKTSDFNYLLPSCYLRKTDIASMSNGIEIRVPFLDDRMIEFSESCNNLSQFSIFGDNKKLIKFISKKMNVSNKILKSKKKGFNVPMGNIFNETLNKFCEKLFTQNVEIFDTYFEIQNIKNIWREHKRKQINHEYVILQLINFSLIRKNFNI